MQKNESYHGKTDRVQKLPSRTTEVEKSPGILELSKFVGKYDKLVV